MILDAEVRIGDSDLSLNWEFTFFRAVDEPDPETLARLIFNADLATRKP